MKPIPLPSCPSCGGPMRPAVLVCDPCGLRVEAVFERNEFASLAGDDLHLLRIFIHCEGSIREMESALGLSYPTIKQRLAELRRKLQPQPAPTQPAQTQPAQTQSSSATAEPAQVDPAPQATNKTATTPTAQPSSAERQIRDVLAALEGGDVNFETALQQIREPAHRRGKP